MSSYSSMRLQRRSRGSVFSPIEQLETRRLLAGDGLLATYFNTANLARPALTRVDPAIDFNWSGAPASGVNADNFSAKWTGLLRADATGPTTFYTSSDDGVRLSINGKTIIDNWTRHSLATNKATINLSAGKYYDIEMDYFDRAGNGTATLAWANSAHSKHFVPSSALFSSHDRIDLEAPTATTSLAATGSSATTMSLSWTAAKDNVGIARYDIYRDGTKIGSTTKTEFVDAGLNQATTYRYAIKTIDTNSNSSRLSVAADGLTNVRTAESLDPGAPSNLAIDAFPNTTYLSYAVQLSWQAPVNSDGVVGYDVYRSGHNAPSGLVDSVDAGTTSVTDAGLFHDEDYTYYVVARHADATHSSASNLLLVHAPGNLRAHEGFYYDYRGAGAESYGNGGGIDFDWGSESPDPKITGNNFTANFNGMVVLPFNTTGTTLHVTSAGGVQVSVNGTLVIDDATQHAKTTDTFTIPAGQTVANVIITYTSTGEQSDAMLKLEWSSDDFGKTLIPESMIFE